MREFGIFLLVMSVCILGINIGMSQLFPAPPSVQVGSCYTAGTSFYKVEKVGQYSASVLEVSRHVINGTYYGKVVVPISVLQRMGRIDCDFVPFEEYK